MHKIPRALAAVSAIFLLATAYLHSTGTNDVRKTLSEAAVQGFFADALPIIWLFFSWHLVAMAVPMLWAAVTNPRWFLPASIFCGTVALGDFFWVYSVAGWFPGSILLLLVVAALAITSIVLTRGNQASAT